MGRTSLDTKDFASAEAEFLLTKAMVEEVVRLTSGDSTHADMNMLVDGYLTLTRTSRPDTQQKGTGPTQALDLPEITAQEKGRSPSC